MDKEYIDKNEILYQMSTGLIPQDYEWTRAYALARKLIKDVPIEDVEPVKHGEWIYDRTYYEADECYCSLCNQFMTTARGVRMKYCPNCGAKMNRGKCNG